MRSGKPGGGKGALLSEELCLTLGTSNDLVLFQELSPASSAAEGELPSDSSGQGGNPLPSARSSASPSLSSRRTGPKSRTSVTSRQLGLMMYLMPPSGWVGSHVRTSHWLDLGEDSGTQTEASPGADSPSLSLGLLPNEDHTPSSWRTLAGFDRVTTDEISSPSSIKWGTSGIRLRSGSWTRNGPVCPSDESGCSSSPSTLSGIVMSTYPERFLVSPRAAQGIMTRSAKRGKPLPSVLREALGLDTHWTVRHLTPTEGERLMGYPDGWTIPKDWTRTASRSSGTES